MKGVRFCSKDLCELAQVPSYSKTTNGINITVYPSYLDEQSSPANNHFLWAYHVCIENKGRQTIQLRSRHWRVIDSLGRTQDIHGGGVVGEQPIIDPGDTFEYTSGTPLVTPSGVMVGSYHMELETGEILIVPVPTFSLDSPHQNIVLN
ncbi:MAG: Co2+/Mg2+ efflux protein ApaG [Alphaproteobacteria bacterium]